MESDKTIILGWEEWVSLPDLGLPAIKAKVDTGAKTSALHAHHIEPFGSPAAPMVRFAVHPRPGRTDIEITCSARVVGRRVVTSSNGEQENRYVIRTRLSVGGRDWPIEVTLSNRETMSYRMLLGREAIRRDVFVDPTASFVQPRLSYKPYRKLMRNPTVPRALRIGVLTRRPLTAANKRLARAARARGHVLETIDAGRLALLFGKGTPSLMLAGKPLPHYDAVIPRLAARNAPFAAAATRQFELMGCHALNPASALDRFAAPLGALQALDAAAVPVSTPGAIQETDLESKTFLKPRGPRIRILLIGYKPAAALFVERGELFAADLSHLIEHAAIAERAARALRLGLAEVSVNCRGNPAVVAVSAMPALSDYESVADVDVSERIITAVEQGVRSSVRNTNGFGTT